MAYFDTKGLFGTTPEEMQREIFEKSQARRQKEMEFLASGTLTPGATYLGLKTLEPLRQQFANVGEDPRVSQLRQRAAAAEEAMGGMSYSDPNQMREAAGRLAKMGRIEDSLRLLTIAASMGDKSKGTAEMQNINYFAKNSYGVDLTDPNTPLNQRQEIINAYYEREQQGAGLEKFLEKFGDQRAEEINTEFKAAEKAPDQINKLNKTLDMLYSGQAYTGVYADVQQNLSRLFAMTDEQKAKVSETQVLEALLGSDVFGQISALGIGARGLDTIPEREYLQKVITGEIKMDREALIKLTEIRREAQEKLLDKWNAKVDKPTGYMAPLVKKGLVKKFEYTPYEKPIITPQVNPDIVKNFSEKNKAVVSNLEKIIKENPDKFDEVMSAWEATTNGKLPFPFVKGSFK
jgi:hypothetical protein